MEVLTMAKIVYKLIKGEATDLRFEKDSYVLKKDEKIVPGDKLPDRETLHANSYKLARDAKQTAKNAIKEKYSGKKISELSDVDVIEFCRQKMGEQLGLEA